MIIFGAPAALYKNWDGIRLAPKCLMQAWIFKRKAWILGLTGLCALSFAIAGKETDSLLIAAQNLRAKTDAYFLFKGVDPELKTTVYLGSDWLKPIWSVRGDKNESYQKLVAEFQSTKKILEQGFAERENQKTSGQRLLKAASAASIYLAQEKRLYLNLFRNIHQLNKGSASDLKELKLLDLMLKSNVAGILYNNDILFGARFNLTHHQDEDGGYNKIEYGVVPAELSEMEQTAIQSVPSREGYPKLIKLMVARERMTNQWALARMQGGVSDLSTYPTCGKELYSFGDLGAGEFYQSLWAQDRGEELALLHSSIAATTLHQPLLSSLQMDKLMHNFYNFYASYVSQNSATSELALNSASDLAKKEQYWATVPQQLIDVIEKDWSLRSTAAVGSVTYPSDLAGDAEISSRIAWVAQYYRQKVLVDTLVNEAAERNIIEVRANPRAARELAEKLVKAAVKPIKAGDLLAREGKIKTVLQAQQSISSVKQHRGERFAALLKRVEPAMSRAAQAGFVLADIDRVVRDHREEWLSSHKFLSSVSSRDWDQFQLGYLPLRGILRDRITLITPDELSLFLSRKLNFWSELDSWWRRLGRAVPVIAVPLGGLLGLKTTDPLALAQQGKRMSKIAARIQANEVVMRGLSELFKNLSEAYQNEIKNLKENGVIITAANTPLYRILPEAAKQSYSKFKRDVRSSVKRIAFHEIKLTGQDQRIDRDDFRAVLAKRGSAVSDHTALKAVNDLSQSRQKAVSNYIESENAQKEAIDLYEQALALINIGEMVSGRVDLVKEELPLLNMIDTPLQMEHVLNHLNPDSKLERRVSQSILDQKFAAQIVMDEMKSEEPLLALRTSPGENAKALGDGLHLHYDVHRGLDLPAVKSETKLALFPAIRRSRSLVNEACLADPVHKDRAFQNIFRGAPTLRAGVIAQNKAYEAYDLELKKEFRSGLEIFKDDLLDPIITIAMWASTIAAIIYFSPVAYAGIATMVATGSLSVSAFSVGALGVLETLEIAGSKGLVSMLVSGTVSKLIARLFLTQVVVWYNVNCIQYPHYAEYQLKVSQAQIQGKNAQITHQDVIDFNEIVSDQKVKTYTLGALVLVPEGFVLAKAGLTAAGVSTSAALSRLEVAGGESGEAAAQSIRSKSISQMIEEHGTLSGAAKFSLEKINALKTLGRVNTLASSASTEKLRELLSSNMSEMLADEVSLLRDLYANRALYLNEKGMRIMSAFRKGNLISKVKGGSFTVNPALQEWVRIKATQIGFKNTPYWKLVVAEDELEAIAAGKLLEGPDSAAEIAGLVQFAYVKGLLAERDFMMQNKAVLDLLLNSGELSGKQILEEHFRVLSDADWNRMETLFQWQAMRSDGVILSSLNSRWMSDSPALVSVKKTFRDYHRLRDESDLITLSSFGKEADSYFSAAGDHQGFEMLVKPQGAPVTSGRYVEIFFDPDAFLALPNP